VFGVQQTPNPRGGKQEHEIIHKNLHISTNAKAEAEAEAAKHVQSNKNNSRVSAMPRCHDTGCNFYIIITYLPDLPT